MGSKMLTKSLLSKPNWNVFKSQIRLASTVPINKIGSREIVGYGTNNEATYIDTVTFPYPAIRFREITPDLKAVREKERGDWRALSLEEKKCLYRISFCQTFAEIVAPTGEWKSIVGYGLIFCSIGVWLYLLVTYIAKNPEGFPSSFDEDHQKAQLKRMLDLRMNPVTGISSKWDFDKNTWK
ncbi:cytochrome c oxidase subunit 4 isoform 1, mitochondrial-like isoform X3 [Rhodnius prolixus]|uniref:cytochrome c oxidase subunit 4 isoform 1, mitochondrial-like isoform X2 n=1 Tax=Rhodnius prolixus TaxID=13249 RepID=UPI003D1889E5